MSGRADIHADFLRHQISGYHYATHLLGLPCLLLIHPGEEDVLPEGSGWGILFWMVSVLLCWRSWMYRVNLVVFSQPRRWLWFCPQRGRLECTSTTRDNPLEKYGRDPFGATGDRCRLGSLEAEPETRILMHWMYKKRAFRENL